MKYLKYFICVFLWIAAASVLAGEMQPYAFPFMGRWNPSENPMLLDDYGLQDIQNLRKSGKHFKGVKGHSKINTTALSLSYVVNGFHFRKDQPQESHVVAVAADSLSSPTAESVYEITAAVPSAGNVAANAIITPAVLTNPVRFSSAPGGSMVMSYGGQTLIWGGNEMPCTAFITSSANVTTSGTSSIDYSEQLSNAANAVADDVTITTGSDYFLVGSKRPVQGVKFYVSSGNSSTSTMTAQEWTDSGWSSLTITHDYTSSGGKTLAQTGAVTFASTVSTSKQRYFYGLSLYWYQFHISAGSANLYYVTVDAPLQSIKNVWDGAEVNAAKFIIYNDSYYHDYTVEAGDNDDNTYAKPNCNDMSSEYMIVGFTSPQQGFSARFVDDYINDSDVTLTVYYWNGTAWTAVSNLKDKTYSNSSSFNNSGTIIFSPAGSAEKTRAYQTDDNQMYYYKFVWSGGLDADNRMSEFRGIPATKVIPPYEFSQIFQNRLWLFNEYNANPNKAVYSAYNTPDVWNGTDSGELYFGDSTKIIAAASIYNVFSSAGGIEQLIVAKKNETYRVTGTKPADWSVQKVSSNVGCVAPLTMVSADAVAVDNVKRQVAIWVSDKGVYMSDGASVTSISDDIRCYFDSNDARYIPLSMQSKSFAWYDPSTRSYKLLIASGSGATYLNTELEYSLQYNEWTKIYREDASGATPLQSGWQVFDTGGNGYTYGGAKNGYIYRLENTNSWDGTSITQYLQTKDILLDQASPLLRKSTIEYIQLAYRKKQTGEITIRHFGDGAETYDGVDGQAGPSNITAAEALGYAYNTQSVQLGPFLYHSFKFQAATNIEDGLELTGMAFYHEPYTAIR